MRREGSKYSLISGTRVKTNATIKSCPSCGTLKSNTDYYRARSAAIHAELLLEKRLLFKDAKPWHELDEQSVDALLCLELLNREDHVAVTWGHLSEWNWARIGLYAKSYSHVDSRIEHPRCVSFGKLNSEVTFGKEKNETGRYAGLKHLSRKQFNRDFGRVKQKLKEVGSEYCEEYIMI